MARPQVKESLPDRGTVADAQLPAPGSIACEACELGRVKTEPPSAAEGLGELPDWPDAGRMRDKVVHIVQCKDLWREPLHGIAPAQHWPFEPAREGRAIGREPAHGHLHRTGQAVGPNTAGKGVGGQLVGPPHHRLHPRRARAMAATVDSGTRS